ncbi:tryptophan synthase subunit alpha, partial [Listeria monocytogenes]|nr:tryptophan synthase subunit alpha [Listeria monocytogenes]
GRGAPILVMTYWNLVLRYGVEAYARDLAAAGGAGLITPDLIPDEAGEWIVASDRHGLDRVFLVAPSSTPERLALTAASSRGFV